ncbi:BrnT family toxin [Polynucleobacter sp. MWH-UH2A]|uniref:BrnT family toxin n=1 Tax=Polynucleobacter sp. MWH-UH2A TaxID=1855617 RepID=UPI001BFE96D9|nr:BrnT family toxin [Polynucleobacter sp. MWH-UH2A]
MAKNNSNLKKHAPPFFSAAQSLDWDTALKRVDRRKEYGEERFVALVPMSQRSYCVVYVESKATIRIISLRKANIREIDKYEEENY